MVESPKELFQLLAGRLAGTPPPEKVIVEGRLCLESADEYRDVLLMRCVDLGR